jgi:hypothetical protein
MKKRSLAIGVFLLGVLAGRGESADPAPVLLWEALRAGQIAATTRSTGGAGAVALTVTNRTSERLTLDVNGALVLPVKTGERRFDQTQPVGVGLIASASQRSDTTLSVPANGDKTVTLLTFCLNQSVPSPCGATPLALAPCPSPDGALTLLRQWRASPKMGQGEVQSEIWSKVQALTAYIEDGVVHSDAIESAMPGTTRERPAAETGLPEDTARVLVVQGSVAVLTSSGNVTLGAPGQSFVGIASGARGLAADKHALHLLVAESPLSGLPAVVRYDVEKRRFTEDLPVDGTDLLWARSSAAIVERGEKLILVERGKERTLTRSHGSEVVDLGDGAMVVAPGDGDGETRLVRVRWSLRGCELVRSGIDAKLTSPCALGGSLYAVDANSGRLVRVRPDGSRRWLGADDIGTSETVQRVAATPRGLVLETSGRALVYKGGAALREIEVDRSARFVQDAATRDLLALTGVSLRRWNEANASWDPVRVDGR